jgi:hypothetical protein
MGNAQFWDDPQRRAEREEALRHVRNRDSDPYIGARLSREIDAIQRSEVIGTPTNFLPVEERTPARPRRQASRPTPSATRAPHARVDANVERLRRAMFAQQVGREGVLSGSHDEHARTRTFDVPQWVPVRRLDAAGRVEEINWASAHRQPD